jgi:hypothetical protein
MKTWSAPTERSSAPAGTLFHLRADGRALYWIRCPSLTEPCALMRLAHDAAAPTVLATRPAMHALALDDASAYVAAGERVLRVPKAGGSPAVLSEGPPAADLQVAGGYVYVGVGDTRDLDGRAASPRAGAILRIPVGGGSATTLGEHHAFRPLLAVDARHVYFTNGPAVSSMALAGGAFTELARDERNAPSAIALEGDAIYFAAGGQVRRVPTSGGAASTLYSAQIVLDVRAAAGAVYAARNLAFDRGAVSETAAIVRITPPAGPAQVMAELRESPRSLAVDATGVFAILVALGPGAGTEPDRIVAYPVGR